MNHEHRDDEARAAAEAAPSRPLIDSECELGAAEEQIEIPSGHDERELTPRVGLATNDAKDEIPFARGA